MSVHRPRRPYLVCVEHIITTSWLIGDVTAGAAQSCGGGKLVLLGAPALAPLLGPYTPSPLERQQVQFPNEIWAPEGRPTARLLVNLRMKGRRVWSQVTHDGVGCNGLHRGPSRASGRSPIPGKLVRLG